MESRRPVRRPDLVQGSNSADLALGEPASGAVGCLTDEKFRDGGGMLGTSLCAAEAGEPVMRTPRTWVGRASCHPGPSIGGAGATNWVTRIADPSELTFPACTVVDRARDTSAANNARSVGRARSGYADRHSTHSDPFMKREGGKGVGGWDRSAPSETRAERAGNRKVGTEGTRDRTLGTSPGTVAIGTVGGGMSAEAQETRAQYQMPRSDQSEWRSRRLMRGKNGSESDWERPWFIGWTT